MVADPSLTPKPSSLPEPTPVIRWVRDDNRVILVDDRHCQRRVLVGDQALIWEWLNAGLAISRCARLLAKVDEITEHQAAEEILGFLQDWRASGWLAAGGEDS